MEEMWLEDETTATRYLMTALKTGEVILLPIYLRRNDSKVGIEYILPEINVAKLVVEIFLSMQEKNAVFQDTSTAHKN